MHANITSEETRKSIINTSVITELIKYLIDGDADVRHVIANGLVEMTQIGNIIYWSTRVG